MRRCRSGLRPLRGRMACSRSPIYAFTSAISAFTFLRSWRSRWTDLGVHDGPMRAAQKGPLLGARAEKCSTSIMDIDSIVDFFLNTPYALIGVGLGVIAIGVVFRLKQEKKRTSDLRRFAMKYGYEFREKLKDLPDIVSLGDRFELFKTGHSGTTYNILQTRRATEGISTFDFNYTVGSGKSSSTHRQTVFSIDSERMSLPHFTLGPERLSHKIGKVFGYQRIDFDSHPEFSRRYLLRGEDIDAIRSLFSHPIRAHFQNHKGWNLEGNGRSLLIYRSGKRVQPSELGTFINDCTRISQLFKRSSQS